MHLRDQFAGQIGHQTDLFRLEGPPMDADGGLGDVGHTLFFYHLRGHEMHVMFRTAYSTTRAVS